MKLGWSLRLALGLALGLALALTFWAYANPHLAVEIAKGVWACF